MNKLKLGNRFKAQVLRRGRVVRETPWASNMILDQGLDAVASTLICDLFTHCAVGSGTTAAAAGQTGLVAELQRSSTYLTGGGSCGSTRDGAVYTHQRVFAFPVESGGVTYSEVGVSSSASAGANLNTRGLFADGPVPVGEGEQLAVVYQVIVTVAPVTPRAQTPTVSGWASAAGTEQLTAEAFSYVDEDGSTQVRHGAVSEPSAEKSAVLSTDATALPAFPADGTALRSALADGKTDLTADSYVPGSKVLTWQATYAASAANSTDIHRLFLCDGTGSGGSFYENGLCYLFDAGQTKANIHILNLVWRFAWDRET